MTDRPPLPLPYGERPAADGGEVSNVVPFGRRGDVVRVEPATRPDPPPPIVSTAEADLVPVDAELVGDAELVPVDPPTAKDVVPVWQREAAVRPVVATWLKDPDTRREAVTWARQRVVHTTAYHGVRAPLYAAQLTAHAPRGAWRGTTQLARWLSAAEEREIRREATWRSDPAQWNKNLVEANKASQMRLLIAAGALGLFAVLTLIAYSGSSSMKTVTWASALGLVGYLGWLGRPLDKPLIGPAVESTAAPRLTADVVARALGSIGVSGINQAMAKGPGISFPDPITRDGPGWRAVIDLPYGVTVSDIMERRERLASGLRRPLGCVWPEPATEAHAGRLVLWVGDRDMNAARPQPWPLAAAGQADLFKPIPFGRDQRGRLVSVLLMFASVLIGAMPRQGKTFAMRVLLTAVALDPYAQMRIFELKGTGDLSPFEPIAHHYASGADDEAVLAALESLRQMYRELETRAKTIRGLPREVCPESKVTPELSRRKSLGLHTVVVAIDECQELFSHPEYGEEAERLCTGIIKRGPALGIILLLATQRPDAKSLPTGISANVGLRFCLRVMGQWENDAVLGTSSYKNGLRATTFGAKDKGIGYLVGATDDPQIVRTAYLDGPATERIVVRARQLRIEAGTLTGQAVGDAPSAAPPTSLLDHILAVVPAGEDRIWSETVVERLAEMLPDLYTGWGPNELAAALRPMGIATDQIGRRIDGKPVTRRGIDRNHIAEAIADRARMRR